MMIAVVAMASFSCAKEIDAPLDKENQKEPENVMLEEGFKLIADVDTDITKTTLSGTSILWDDTDAVKAYGDHVYTSTGITRTNSNKTAEFSFGPLEAGDAVLYALYPAAKAGGTDYDNLEITIPTEQVATVGSFDPAAMAAIGEIDGSYKIAFKNIGALLSIVINNDDIASVELSATEESGESMTGTATVAIDGLGAITSLTDGLSTSVKLTGGLVNGETYYFVIYPGTYSNLRIVVTDTDGAIAVYRNKTPFTVARNENWKIAELTIPSEKWVPEEVNTTLFYESFDGFTGNANNVGGNDGSWSGINPSGTTTYDNDGWEITSPGGADRCLKSGSGSKVGVATTPVFSGIGAGSKDVTLSFKAAEWTGDGTDLSLSITGGGTLGQTAFTMGSGAWANLQTTITGATASTKVTFTPTKRMFLDEVKVTGLAARDDNPKHYTVTYNANTGSGDAPTDDTDYNDQTNFIVTVADKGELTKTGHTFNGWNTAADGSGTDYAAGATFVIKSNVTLYAQWAPIVYTITKNVNSHGTYTVKDSENNEVSTATYGTSLTLTANTPDAGYAFEKFVINYTKEDSTPGVSNFTSNPKAYTMPASDIEITLVLSETTKYNVTLMYNGSTHSVVPVSEGASILDAISSVGSTLTPPTGKSFLGWSTSSDPASVSLITSSTLASSSITLYAVFGSAAKYVLVESDLGSANWAGDYLIAYDDDTFMDGSLPGGKDSGQVGYANTSVDPDTALSANKKEVTSAWGDLHYLTLEAVTGGYVLKTHSSTTPYIYRSANSNGMDASVNQSTAATYKITVTFNSSDDVRLSCSSGPTLRYNTANSIFRYYKNAGQEAVYLYKKQLGETIITW